MIKVVLIMAAVILLLGLLVYFLIRKINKQSVDINQLTNETERLKCQLDKITLEQKIKTEVENDARYKKNKIRSGDNVSNFNESLNVLRDN